MALLIAVMYRGAVHLDWMLSISKSGMLAAAVMYRGAVHLDWMLSISKSGMLAAAVVCTHALCCLPCQESWALLSGGSLSTPLRQLSLHA